MNTVSRATRNLVLIYRYQTPLASTFQNLTSYHKGFHCNSKLCIKMFMEYENKYAYDVMETKGYAQRLKCSKKQDVPLTKVMYEKWFQENLSTKSAQEIFEIFPKLGVYCCENDLCISNKVFDNYIDHLTDNIKHASDKELESIFYALTKWPETDSVRTRNFIEVWAALDDECLQRMRRWSNEENLSFIALFYMLNVTRFSEFTQKSIQRLATKAKHLTPGQTVQTLFFISILRKQPYDMHNLEIELSNQFTKFTIDELAIISMGFFKSRTPIRNVEIVRRMVNRVIENSKDIHDVALAALLKIIRYSMRSYTDDKTYKLLDSLQHEVPRLSVMCNVHVALLGTSTLTLHPKCLDLIGESTFNSMSNARLKDLERLVLTYAVFNYRPPTKKCFFQVVIEELRKPERQIEIEKHGRAFACCVAYLGHLGIYPEDLINKVLSRRFLEMTYGKTAYVFGREILVLHNTVKIFCKDAEINRLTDKEAVLLAKKYTDFMPSEDYQKQYNASERMFLDVAKTLKEARGGDDFVTGQHILTHHQRGDIIVCNNHKGLPVPVVGAFKDRIFGYIQTPPDNNKWIVFVITGRNGLVNNFGTPTGPFLTKIRELKALGFYPILVHSVFYEKLETKEQKSHYLNSLIEEALK